MARAFVSQFLLPLVRGGRVAVGRPISRRALEKLARTYIDKGSSVERAAAEELSRARQRIATSLLAGPPLPLLDETTWRLGAAVHNLLALGHPDITRGPGSSLRLSRIAAAATELASVGAPSTQTEAVARHSLLARLSEVIRPESTVTYWLGQMTYVGQTPPARVTVLPHLRGVKVETVRRYWLRDIGVPSVGRAAFSALLDASPLGDALDPLRLDPPVLWGRMLSVLRFPALCRAVASRVLTMGIRRSGDMLVDGLYRFAALQDPPSGIRASPEAVGFAIRFLAHLAWLDYLFGSRAVADEGESAGRDFAVVLAAAGRVQKTLLWPTDVPSSSDVGQGFSVYLQDLFARFSVDQSPRWPAAHEIAELATAPSTLVL